MNPSGLKWQKASASMANGHCVEVAWQEDAASMSNGQCIEVTVDGGEVLMRNSRYPEGTVLRFTRAEWDAFLHGAKGGEFDDMDLRTAAIALRDRVDRLSTSARGIVPLLGDGPEPR